MRNQSTALVLGLSTLLAGGAVCAFAAPRPAALVVRKRVVKPLRLSGQGGPVFIRVQVSKKRATILQVTAQGSVPGGGAGKYATLTRHGAFWEGNVTVPRNTLTKANTATIMVTVTSSEGTEQRVLTRLSMLAGNDFFPPDPPK